MYKYIYFDLDGTLTDSGEGIKKSVLYALEKMGYTPLPDATLNKFIGPPLGDSFMVHCGMSQEESLRAIDTFRERYAPIGILENTAVEGICDVLRELRERGYVLALASSKPQPACESVTGRFGMAQYLNVLSGSTVSHKGDSKADVLRRAMEMMGNPPVEESLMVGDRKYDVLGAKECGMDCVGVEFCPYADEGELEEAGAIAVVQTPQQLLEFILRN
ncbi:MAG: HAD hydrolase-like protein [Oscillospiraceae bacterium]|nr:HAD hydrolase-like protein [Oscillospiraceae bacterium]